MTLHEYDLDGLGWTPELEDEFQPHADSGLAPGRVGAQYRGAYVLYTKAGDCRAEISGRLRHEALAPADLPAAGDWVAFRLPDGDGHAAIHAVLPRRTCFSRTGVAVTEEQILAANVDTAFIVTALGHDLNPRRLERYLATAWESGADPVVVVTKTDLYDDVPARLVELEAVSVGVPLLPISNLTGEGVDGLRGWLTKGRTVALLGSSGVGKSSLANRLLGEERQDVKEIREDGRGRHTTTHRELLVVPSGGLLLDTPGMRALELWDAGEGVSGAFADVEEAAARCRFSDCGHETEPGCAVRAALDAGTLDPERVASYDKLQRELAFVERKQNKRAAAEERRRWRAVSVEQRRRYRVAGKGRR